MISVVTPIYNASRFLVKAVESVQAQTFPHWELILVDDGSKDDSLTLAQRLSEEDGRIRVFSQQNAGAAAARNYGLFQAQADYPYALCLDSDDLLLPNALEVLRALLEAHPEASAACGFLKDIDADGGVIPNHHRLEPLDHRHGLDGLRLVRRKPDAPVTFGDLCFRNHIVTPGQVLMRKSALAVVGGFVPGLVYVEDHDLWWRLAMQFGPIAVTLKPVMLYRHHGSSLSSNNAAPRRGAAAFRWRLLTLPEMSVKQRRIARAGYLYNCLAMVGFGANFLRQGRVKPGFKYAALGIRNVCYYFRDLVRSRLPSASDSPMPPH